MKWKIHFLLYIDYLLSLIQRPKITPISLIFIFPFYGKTSLAFLRIYVQRRMKGAKKNTHPEKKNIRKSVYLMRFVRIFKYSSCMFLFV